MRDLAELGARIILANTYHLHLRPGDDLIARARRAAPLHRLGRARSSPTPAAIRSSASRPPAHHRGRRAFSVAPRRQRALPLARVGRRHSGARSGSDVAMMLDECPLSGRAARRARGDGRGRCAGPGAAHAMRLSARLASPDGRSGPASPLINPGQAQFGIVQGGVLPGSARPERRRDGRRRLRGLRHRRPLGRRADPT